jgi:uncharacterized protein
VPTNRFPLRINIGFLQNQPVGTSREIHFETPDFKMADEYDPSELRGLIRVSRTPQGVLAQGVFNTTIKAECVRCLEEFNKPLRTVFTELYSYHSHPTTDVSMVIPEDGNVDFAPLVREFLLLEVPIKLLCREDCFGLCSICGENLNLTTCEHQAQLIERES